MLLTKNSSADKDPSPILVALLKWFQTSNDKFSRQRSTGSFRPVAMYADPSARSGRYTPSNSCTTSFYRFTNRSKSRNVVYLDSCSSEAATACVLVHGMTLLSAVPSRVRSLWHHSLLALTGYLLPRYDAHRHALISHQLDAPPAS